MVTKQKSLLYSMKKLYLDARERDMYELCILYAQTIERLAFEIEESNKRR